MTGLKTLSWQDDRQHALALHYSARLAYLELTVRAGHGDCDVVAHDLRGDHGKLRHFLISCHKYDASRQTHRFALRRVDFARLCDIVSVTIFLI